MTSRRFALILARHGNTFEAGETSCIVGRTEDPPLTKTGEAQARRMANYLHAGDLRPDVIFCGELARTHRTAAIVADYFRLPPPLPSPLLTEIDYGQWAGLAMDEVRRRFGNGEVDAWENDAVMPEGRGWSPTGEVIRRNVIAFAEQAAKATPGVALAVTSNGVLRFFASLAVGLPETLRTQRQLKVGTGNLCRLDLEDGAFRPVFWNVNPNEAA